MYSPPLGQYLVEPPVAFGIQFYHLCTSGFWYLCIFFLLEFSRSDKNHWWNVLFYCLKHSSVVLPVCLELLWCWNLKLCPSFKFLTVWNTVCSCLSGFFLACYLSGANPDLFLSLCWWKHDTRFSVGKFLSVMSRYMAKYNVLWLNFGLENLIPHIY